MALSKRGQNWADLSSNLVLWSVLKDLWHPRDNPNGYVSLGVAENTLMHDEMTEYVNSHAKLPPYGLTYGDGGAGSKTLQEAAAHFLNRKLKPVVPLKGTDICATNGVSSAIEHLSSILTDDGDVFLLGRPHYGAFILDIELRTGTKVGAVSFGDIDPLSMPAIGAYERTIEACQADGQHVAALMLCNPHNPLGRCYSREYIIELMKLCQRHKIHLVSDEIYALSVFRASGDQDVQAHPFTSLASIPTQGLIDPALTHILYGLSKDFGANGLRMGFIVSQHNPQLHEALVPVVLYSYASSLAQSVATTLLLDDEYVDWYTAENCRRLSRNHARVVEWAERHRVQYKAGVNAAFFLWVNLGSVYTSAVKEGRIGETTTLQVDDNLNELVERQLLKSKIFLASGATFGGEQPGWFRIVFSQSDGNLTEGLKRIEGALGLIDQGRHA